MKKTGRQSTNIEDVSFRNPKAKAMEDLKSTMAERVRWSDHVTDDTLMKNQQGDPDERATNKGLNLHQADRINRDPGFLKHNIKVLGKF